MTSRGAVTAALAAAGAMSAATAAKPASRLAGRAAGRCEVRPCPAGVRCTVVFLPGRRRHLRAVPSVAYGCVGGDVIDRTSVVRRASGHWSGGPRDVPQRSLRQPAFDLQIIALCFGLMRSAD